MIMRHYLEMILANHPSVREVRVRAVEPRRGAWEYCAYVVLIRDTPVEYADFLKDNADFLQGLNATWEILSEIPETIRNAAFTEPSFPPAAEAGLLTI